jgi:hypothetical protein
MKISLFIVMPVQGIGNYADLPTCLSLSFRFSFCLRFEFDRVLAPGTAQEVVFDAVQPLIVSVLDGYNVCIFACESPPLLFVCSSFSSAPPSHLRSRRWPNWIWKGYPPRSSTIDSPLLSSIDRPTPWRDTEQTSVSPLEPSMKCSMWSMAAQRTGATRYLSLSLPSSELSHSHLHRSPSAV